MACLNFSIPQVKKDYDELSKVFQSAEIAYALMVKNNSYNLDLTPQGKPSLLYNTLMKLDAITGREDALKWKAKVYSKSYLNSNDWIKTSKEPNLLDPIFEKIKHTPSTPTKLPGLAMTFMGKKGMNTSKALLTTQPETTEDRKLIEGLKILLEDSSEEFKENGLFEHKGNPIIAGMTERVLKNMTSTRRLIDYANKTVKDKLIEKGAKHNVISTRKNSKDETEYWVIMTDSDYADLKWDYASAPERRTKILERNKEVIRELNQNYVEVIGKPVMILEDVKLGNFTANRVYFDEQAMKEWNSVKYTQYLNSMKQYLHKTVDVVPNLLDIQEDLNIEPVIKTLNKEKRQLKQEKANLEVTGGKQSDINRIENKIDNIVERIKKIKEDGELVDVYNEAELNLKEVRDVINSGKLTTTQFQTALKKLQIWIAAGDFSDINHLFLDEEMRESDIIRDKFAGYAGRAQLLMADLVDKGKNLLSNIVSSEFGTELSYDKVVSLTHKLGFFNKNTLSLNRVGHALAQYIFKVVNDANDSAFREAKIESRYLSDLFKKIKDKNFDERLFYQFEEVLVNGVKKLKFTGRLVHKFSQKYFNSFGKERNRIKFRREKELTINPLLLDGSSEESKKHLADIELQLGKIGATEYVDKAIQRYNSFLEVRESHIALEYGDEELTESQKEDLKIWDEQNNPINRINNIDKTKMMFLKDVPGKDTFLVIIPRRVDKKGKDLGFYDKRFESIEADPDAYEFYKKSKEITNRAQTLFGFQDITSTSLAFVEQSMLDKFSNLGTAEFLSKEVWTTFLESFGGGTTKAEYIDPVTKKPIKSIRPDVVTIDSMITELAKKKRKELEATTGEKIKWKSAAMQEILVEASEEVLSKMNFEQSDTGLFKSLNMLNLSALNYKHASLIEDTVNMALTYLPNSTVNTGNNIIDSEGNTVGAEYIDNLKQMTDYFLSNQYYKEPQGDSSATLGKFLTPEQKEYKKELEKKLEDPNIEEEELITIKNELDSLGVRVTVNSLVKRIMDFIRLKGMGWNIPASIVNLAYGKITNMYKAAEGRLYTFKEWVAAEGVIFSQWNKFNKVTENYNILGDILYEFKESNAFEEDKGWFFKKIKAVKPYAMQTATEKSNQGTVMIAMMMHKQVTNSKGEIKSLWDAIDEDGKLSNDWGYDDKFGDAAIQSIVSKIKSQIQEIHGDYSNPLMIKDSVVGRTLSMFRLWFFESFHSRFGAKKQDYIRGLETEGRYITAAKLAKKFGFNPIAFWKAFKNKELTEVEIANMKVNMTEAATMVISYALLALLKKSICGDDEKCRDASLGQVAILNTMRKLTKDVNFWINPGEWKNFIENPTAMTSILGDMVKLWNLTTTEMFGEEEDMIYKSGYNKDRSKWEVFTLSQIPFANSIERMKRYGEELMQSKN